MIIGSGIDIEEVESVDMLLKNAGRHFIRRCFLEVELRQAGDGKCKSQRLAAIYAGKEAVLKAIGTGFSNGVGYHQVFIDKAFGMSPLVVLSGHAAELSADMKIEKWWLSIALGKSIVVASAIAEGR